MGSIMISANPAVAVDDKIYQLVAVMRKLWPASAYKSMGLGIWFVSERGQRTAQQVQDLKIRAEAKRQRKAAKRVNK